MAMNTVVISFPGVVVSRSRVARLWRSLWHVHPPALFASIPSALMAARIGAAAPYRVTCRLAERQTSRSLTGRVPLALRRRPGREAGDPARHVGLVQTIVVAEAPLQALFLDEREINGVGRDSQPRSERSLARRGRGDGPAGGVHGPKNHRRNDDEGGPGKDEDCFEKPPDQCRLPRSVSPFHPSERAPLLGGHDSAVAPAWGQGRDGTGGASNPPAPGGAGMVA